MIKLSDLGLKYYYFILCLNCYSILPLILLNSQIFNHLYWYTYSTYK